MLKVKKVKKQPKEIFFLLHICHACSNRWLTIIIFLSDLDKSVHNLISCLLAGARHNIKRSIWESVQGYKREHK
jgi:hypothetical protein